MSEPTASSARGWLSTASPSAAIEFAADRVTAVRVTRTRDMPVIDAHATEALPPGCSCPP